MPTVEHLAEDVVALAVGASGELCLGVVVDKGVDAEDLFVDLRVEEAPLRECVDMLGEPGGGDAVFELFDSLGGDAGEAVSLLRRGRNRPDDEGDEEKGKAESGSPAQTGTAATATGDVGLQGCDVGVTLFDGKLAAAGDGRPDAPSA